LEIVDRYRALVVVCLLPRSEICVTPNTVGISQQKIELAALRPGLGQMQQQAAAAEGGGAKVGDWTTMKLN
jgi:hypothetical protein